MSDIPDDFPMSCFVSKEARDRAMAEEITLLRARVEKLEEALKPFAELVDDYGGGYADYDSAFVAVKHLRRARVAYGG